MTGLGRERHRRGDQRERGKCEIVKLEHAGLLFAAERERPPLAANIVMERRAAL